MRNLYESLARAWCRQFHGRPMHPNRGIYRCRRCLRAYPAWQGSSKPQPISPKGKVVA